MSRIFISYRRKDSNFGTDRIYDVLSQRFGKDAIFRDVAQIRYGDDFQMRINTALSQCQVLIVVIGEAWLHAKDDYGDRRLDNPGDLVRLEVEAALERGILVIPVLINNAKMPRPADLPSSLQPLASRNAAHVRAYPDFDSDMERLGQALQDHFDDLSRPQVLRVKTAPE
ncbi:MAG: toll/interleukin-1 receptor domain-containing protein, partial [Cyanobacteria bacterium J06555_13]